MRFPDKYRARGGEWALVTGAAGGIGLAFADRLASLGYNLVLADIVGEGLQRVAADISARHGVTVRHMQIDLSRHDAAARLHDFCSEQAIEPLIVINNAGIFSYNDILATSPARIELFAGLHVVTVSMICRLFGADMAGRGTQTEQPTRSAVRRRRGFILNISSYSTWMPWPGLALYSATKSYIRSFSLAFAAEMREMGVGVTTVLPAGVTTGLYGLAPKWQEVGRRLGILLTPERTADMALKAMFRCRRQYVPGFFMRFILPVVRNLPAWIIRIARRKTLQFQK